MKDQQTMSIRDYHIWKTQHFQQCQSNGNFRGAGFCYPASFPPRIEEVRHIGPERQAGSDREKSLLICGHCGSLYTRRKESQVGVEFYQQYARTSAEQIFLTPRTELKP